MDPNANLAEQLRLARKIQSCESFQSFMMASADCERLAELVEAMHEWVSKGGFLPDAWKRAK